MGEFSFRASTVPRAFTSRTCCGPLAADASQASTCQGRISMISALKPGMSKCLPQKVNETTKILSLPTQVRTPLLCEPRRLHQDCSLLPIFIQRTKIASFSRILRRMVKKKFLVGEGRPHEALIASWGGSSRCNEAVPQGVSTSKIELTA
jgi:hypothetical protein